MSTSINNPEFLSSNEAPTAQGFTPSNQLIDDTDFPHSGLFKVLSLAVAGGYAIEGFNATAVSNTSITVAEGKVFRDGKLHQVDYSNATTQTLTIPATANRYHLLVNPSANPNTLAVRQATADNQIPNYTAGDVIIAVLKGGTTPMQIQYLTFNQSTKSVSIGRNNSGTYTEVLEIIPEPSGDAQDVRINIKDTTGGGGDLKFFTPSGLQALLIDGAQNKIRIGGDASLGGAGGSTVGSDLEIGGKGGNVAFSPTLTLQNENTHADSCRINMFRNDTGLSNGDSIGDMVFFARDNSNGSYVYSRIEGVMTDRTATQGDGRLVLYAVKAGTEAEFMRIDGIDGIVFNEGSADIDFRVESNGQANMLFVDASTDKVGIGTNAPTERLDVNGYVKALGVRTGSLRSQGLEIIAGTSNFTLVPSLHAGTYVIYTNANGTITLPATSSAGEHYTILNTTGGNITVGRNGNNINGAASDITVGTYNGVTCISVGNNDWIALGV